MYPPKGKPACGPIPFGHRARPNPPRQGQGEIRVEGEDRAVETIRAIVGDRHGLVDAVVGLNNKHGTEDFLPRDAHLVGDIGENGRLNEAAVHDPTGHQARA